MTTEPQTIEEDAASAHLSDDASSGVDISILIVGFNSKGLTMDCLEGLYEHTRGPSVEVLYTDCSNDGSMREVPKRFPAVRVIDNTENLGFGRGNNFLARHARGRYILLINPDTLINDNAIGALFDFAERTPIAGAWGGVTKLPDGGIESSCQQPAHNLGCSLLMLCGLSSLACPDVTKADANGMDVPSLSGAFMMLPRDLWEQLGGFDESFFMYCEETDLCHRVHQQGKPVLITNESSIVHLVGSGSAFSAKRMLSMSRGAMHFARKHHSPLYVFATGLVRWVHNATRYALGLVGRPLIGAQRAARLRERHKQIVMQPGQWYGGWNESNTNALKPTAASTNQPQANAS